jgi:ribosomal protein L11 methylase PrmA
MPSNTARSDPAADRPGAEGLRGRVLEMIAGRRCCPADLIRALSAGDARWAKPAVRAAIQALVAAGELAYTFEHGRSFLEPSFDRPVRVGERIILCPPGRDAQAGPGDIVVLIASGAAFGAGRHPTTRLALRGIEHALGRVPGGRPPGRRALDIGTGTGVLVMAAVKLGIPSGTGIDIDPCAVAEAGENLRRNGLAGAIHVTGQAIDDLTPGFDLVAANLRAPTLARLSEKIHALTAPGGAVVMSGLRVAERRDLLAAYAPLGFTLLWEGAEDDWAGVVLRRPG